MGNKNALVWHPTYCTYSSDCCSLSSPVSSSAVMAQTIRPFGLVFHLLPYCITYAAPTYWPPKGCPSMHILSPTAPHIADVWSREQRPPVA